MAAELGNATLLTMQGDGHTAYGGRSACIDAAVDAYLEEGTLPAPDARCSQDTPFQALELPPEAAASGAARAAALSVRARRLGRFRLR